MALTTFEKASKSGTRFTLFDKEGSEIATGIWSGIRVDRRTLEEGWNAYDIREADDQSLYGWLGTIEENYVIVNHAGTFLTKDKLDLPHGVEGRKWANIGSSEIDDFDYSFS